ncbi:UNVERIFIED_CONTAM: hypothetical protein Sindi_1412800 [Sesamum indicum]
MDESSGNSRSNSSSDMSSDEENNLRLIHELLSTSILKTKQPHNNSILQGSDWLSELLSGHPDRIYNMLRMNKETFQNLRLFLKGKGILIDSQRTRVSVMESVAIFLQTVGLSERQRTSCEWFQHSLETISRHMKRVSRALNLLAPELISASVPVSMQNAYRSRHGDTSQNVMVVCDFDLMFTYVMARWEGSANDARVFMDCLNNDQNFPWPPNGKYYLVDSAYPDFPGFLAPYRQDRYHINSFRGNNQQAHSPKELFNQRHSQLRNVIERAFGVLKNRFPILKGPMPPYSLDRQRDLVIACCVIHNFIRKFGIDDQFFERGKRGEFDNANNEANDQFRRLPQQSQEDIDTQSAFRDAMAGHLWNVRGTGNDNID